MPGPNSSDGAIDGRQMTFRRPPAPRNELAAAGPDERHSWRCRTPQLSPGRFCRSGSLPADAGEKTMLFPEEPLCRSAGMAVARCTKATAGAPGRG